MMLLTGRSMGLPPLAFTLLRSEQMILCNDRSDRLDHPGLLADCLVQAQGHAGTRTLSDEPWQVVLHMAALAQEPGPDTHPCAPLCAQGGHDLIERRAVLEIAEAHPRGRKFLGDARRHALEWP